MKKYKYKGYKKITIVDVSENGTLLKEEIIIKVNWKEKFKNEK